MENEFDYKKAAELSTSIELNLYSELVKWFDLRAESLGDAMYEKVNSSHVYFQPQPHRFDITDVINHGSEQIAKFIYGKIVEESMFNCDKKSHIYFGTSVGLCQSSTGKWTFMARYAFS